MSPNCDGSPLKAPTNVTSRLKKVLGIDEDDQSAALESSPGLLYSPGGGELARWADGSDDNPIVMNELAVSAIGGVGVLAKGPDGRLYAMKAPASGRHVLVHDGSSVIFENEGDNKITFNRSDVRELSGCGFSFAVWESCNPDGITRIRKITPDQLCSYLPEIDEPPGIIGCGPSGMSSIVGQGRGSMLIHDGDKWTQESADMRYKFIGHTRIYWGATTLVPINWANLGIPQVGVFGNILADLQIINTVAGPPGSILYCEIAGAGYGNVYSGVGGGQQQSWVSWKLPVSASVPTNIRGVMGGSPSFAETSVWLAGFYH